MSSTTLSQDFRIGFLVHDVSRMRRTLFDQAMKPLGITRSQWWVLSELSRHGRDGMLQTPMSQCRSASENWEPGASKKIILDPSSMACMQCLLTDT